jgi:TatD DNase family protein
MGFIDTHTHLYTEEFNTDRAAVVERARQAGAEALLLPNIDRTSVPSMMEMVAHYPGYIFPMIGLHPTEIGDNYRQDLVDMEAMLTPDHPFVAIGEVGMDLYWEQDKEQVQREVFDTQIQWAVRHRLPLMIHCRNAQKQLLEVMYPYRDEHITGVFHCFGGTPEEAQELLKWDGFVLGIGGTLTYKKSPLPTTLAEVVPIERIVLETDSPYLAPMPNRGKRNESAYARFVLYRLAEIYQIPVEEMEHQLRQNALRIFPRCTLNCSTQNSEKCNSFS